MSEIKGLDLNKIEIALVLQDLNEIKELTSLLKNMGITAHFYNDLVNTNLITAFATTETKKGAITDDMLDNVTEWLNHLIKSKKEYEEYQESFERIL